MLDTDSLELFYLITTGCHHTSDLSIFSFLEDNTKSVRAHSLHLRRLCLNKLLGSLSCRTCRSWCRGFWSFCECVSHSTRHLFERFVIYLSIRGHEIFFLVFKRRMKKSVGDTSVIGEKNQTA